MKRKIKNYLSFGRRKLVAFRKKITYSSHGANSYVIFFSNGQRKSCIGKICYANLDRIRHISNPIVIISTSRDSFCSHDGDNMSSYKKDVAIKFLDWIVRHSPWQDVFHTTNGKDAFNLGVVCKTIPPANLILGGLMAIREVDEYYPKVLAWEALVGLGLSPTFAYYSTYFVNYDRQTKIFTRDRRDFHEGHRPLNAKFMNKESVISFLLKRIRLPTKSLHDKGTYHSVDNTWGSVAEANDSDTVKRLSRNGDIVATLLELEMELLNG